MATSLCVGFELEILRWGYLGIVAFSGLVYLIPFIGPSVMVLSGTIAAIVPQYHPAGIGIAVAAGASLAKAIHYYTSYFAGRALSAESANRLRGYGQRLGRWKSVATIIAAATPIPEEPVLVSLALLKYDPRRFLLFFLFGKLAVTIPGAYLGRAFSASLSELAGSLPVTVASIITSVAVTLILVKVDLGKLQRRLTSKRHHG